MEIPVEYRAQILRDEPVLQDGLLFYPVPVYLMEDFFMAERSLSFMLSRLPAKYAVKPYLAAFFSYDADALLENREPSGLFSGCLAALALSLRIGEGEEISERLKNFKVAVDPLSGELKGVKFKALGEREIEVSPEMFSRWRELIALQNGVKLFDESQNPEIIDAERELLEASGPRLSGDIYSVISAMAVFCHADEGEILNWSIRKFRNRKAACDRLLNYLLCGVAERVGFVKYKNGNPYPSWCLDRDMERGGLIELSQFMAGKNGVMAEKTT